VLVDEKLNMTRQCALAAQHASCKLSCIKRTVARRLRQVVLPLYSALVRPRLESCIQLWSHQYRKDMDLLEWGQSSTLLLIEPASSKETAVSLSLGRDPGSLDRSKPWPWSCWRLLLLTESLSTKGEKATA